MDTHLPETHDVGEPRVKDIGRFSTWSSTKSEPLPALLLLEGARTYVTIAGGLDVPAVLGSCSTHVRSHTGGLDGRPPREGRSVERRQASSAMDVMGGTET